MLILIRRINTSIQTAFRIVKDIAKMLIVALLLSVSPKNADLKTDRMRCCQDFLTVKTECAEVGNSNRTFSKTYSRTFQYETM